MVNPASEQIVYMNDLEEFGRVLGLASSRTADDVTTRVIHSMGEQVARLAYQYAPKDTFELANSIELRLGHQTAQVAATAPHAVFIEFGTWSHNVLNPRQGTYTIRPRNAQALRFTGKDGNVVFTKKVEHPGIRAHLFMQRANEETIEEFVGQLADVGVYLVMQ